MTTRLSSPLGRGRRPAASASTNSAICAEGDAQRHRYPLTPVSVIPSMNTFCAKMKMTITGSTNSSDAAI